MSCHGGGIKPRKSKQLKSCYFVKLHTNLVFDAKIFAFFLLSYPSNYILQENKVNLNMTI